MYPCLLFFIFCILFLTVSPCKGRLATLHLIFCMIFLLHPLVLLTFLFVRKKGICSEKRLFPTGSIPTSPTRTVCVQPRDGGQGNNILFPRARLGEMRNVCKIFSRDVSSSSDRERKYFPPLSLYYHCKVMAENVHI